MRGRLTALALLAALPAAGPVPARAAEAEVGCLEVATRAPNNPVVPVWYRVPRGYDPSRRARWRVLVLFGGRNADGRPEVSGKLGWTAWADLNGVFLVAPTLRDDAYWEPEAWSGRALLDALAMLAAKYRVAQAGLLLYGYSAGSQAANLFPAWRPGLCRAYASHACGVFHGPSAKMRGVAGLVTCGDADAARYALGRRFVSACRARGVPVVWRSFPNRPHDVPAASARLAREFLAHHHWAHPEDLGGAPVPSAPGDLRRRRAAGASSRRRSGTGRGWRRASRRRRCRPRSTPCAAGTASAPTPSSSTAIRRAGSSRPSCGSALRSPSRRGPSTAAASTRRPSARTRPRSSPAASGTRGGSASRAPSPAATVRRAGSSSGGRRGAATGRTPARSPSRGRSSRRSPPARPVRSGARTTRAASCRARASIRSTRTRSTRPRWPRSGEANKCGAWG